MAWKGMKDKWPAAYKFLKAYQLRNKDEIPMMNAIDKEGKDLKAVVKEWVSNNESVWKPWVYAAKQ